jgi:hypothetical protein
MHIKVLAESLLTSLRSLNMSLPPSSNTLNSPISDLTIRPTQLQIAKRAIIRLVEQYGTRITARSIIPSLQLRSSLHTLQNPAFREPGCGRGHADYTAVRSLVEDVICSGATFVVTCCNPRGIGDMIGGRRGLGSYRVCMSVCTSCIYSYYLLLFQPSVLTTPYP